MIKISVSQQGTKKAQRFIQVLIKELKRSTKELETSTVDIADGVAQYIFNRILEEHPLKEWMAARTKVEFEPKGASLAIKFSGRQLEGDQANLWNVHEYGAHIPAITAGQLGKPLAFQKDDGTGQIVYTWTRKAYDINIYKGEVDSIVRSSMMQAKRIATGILGKRGAEMIGEALRVASEGEITITSGANKILSRAGVSTADLAQIGASGAMVNPLTGGISLRGASGRFIANPGKLRGVRLK